LFYTPQLTLAKVLLSQGTEASKQRCGHVLNRLRHFFESTHSIYPLIGTLALQALLHSVEDDESAALLALNQAVSLAEPGGLLRIFLDLGPDMASLLRRLNNQKPASQFVGQVLQSFVTSSPTLVSARQDCLIEPLTERELEILGLLTKRLSNKEIASQLVVSPGTVKSHTIHIYQKLAVQSRRDAVRKAVALGIIPAPVGDPA
jgi:LuxR family maltose regulon positive regulatory protein